MDSKVINIQPIADVWNTAWHSIQKRTGSPEIEIPFLPALSEKIWGLHRKEMMVVGARTSQGKTTFALQLAYHCAKQGFRTHLLSLEMSPEALVERLFCQICRISNYDLLVNPKGYEERAKEFHEFLKDLPLIPMYKIGSTIQELFKLIESIPADVLILDYVQAIRSLEFDRLSIINDYILKFRELCVNKNMAGVMVSQINRGAMEDRERLPQLWHLKASGALEEIADQVLLLHWPYFYSGKDEEHSDFKVIIAKNRNGMLGTVEATFEPAYYLIGEKRPGAGKASPGYKYPRYQED